MKADKQLKNSPKKPQSLRKTKYLSKPAAVETLVRWFSAAPESNEISVEEIFRLSGRQSHDPQKNKMWLSNKLTDFRHHQLVRPVYNLGRTEGSQFAHRRLEKIALTAQGKQALALKQTSKLRRQDGPSNQGALAQRIVSQGGARHRDDRFPVTLNDLPKLITQLQKESPDYEITFTLRLK